MQLQWTSLSFTFLFFQLNNDFFTQFLKGRKMLFINLILLILCINSCSGMGCSVIIIYFTLHTFLSVLYIVLLIARCQHNSTSYQYCFHWDKAVNLFLYKTFFFYFSIDIYQYINQNIKCFDDLQLPAQIQTFQFPTAIFLCLAFVLGDVLITTRALISSLTVSSSGEGPDSLIEYSRWNR